MPVCFPNEGRVSPKSSISKTSDYHHGNLRTALVEAGRQALKEVNPQDLSLRYLARMVGVSEAAPSRHFSGIDELLATIAASGFRELAALRIEIRDGEGTALSRAYRMMRGYVEFAQHHKGLFGLMIGPRIIAREAYPELTEEIDKSFALFAEAIESLAIENGWNRADLNLVTHASWSMEHGLATLILSDRAPRPDRRAPLRDLIDFAIMSMLGAITAGPAHLKNVVEQCTALQDSQQKSRPARSRRSE